MPWYKIMMVNIELERRYYLPDHAVLGKGWARRGQTYVLMRNEEVRKIFWDYTGKGKTYSASIKWWLGPPTPMEVFQLLDARGRHFKNDKEAIEFLLGLVVTRKLGTNVQFTLLEDQERSSPFLRDGADPPTNEKPRQVAGLQENRFFFGARQTPIGVQHHALGSHEDQGD